MILPEFIFGTRSSLLSGTTSFSKPARGGALEAGGWWTADGGHHLRQVVLELEHLGWRHIEGWHTAK